MKVGGIFARAFRVIADELDAQRAAGVIRDGNAEARHAAQMAKLDAILGALPPLARRVELLEEDVETLKRSNRPPPNGKGLHL